MRSVSCGPHGRRINFSIPERTW